MKYQNNPYMADEPKRILANPATGLSSRQARHIAQQGYANLPVQAPFKTTGRIVWDNVFTFFNLIFVVLAVCLILVGSYKNTLFLGIVTANILIGIIQQLRSKKALEKLTVLSSPKVCVIRDGKRQNINSEEPVRDDVVEFSTGNQICADAVLVSGQLRVNESLLTGESDSVVKKPGDELLSGSFVVAGCALARLERVGSQSYAARLTLEAKKETRVHKSEMMRSLDKLIRVIGYILVPIGLLLFLKQAFVLHMPYQNAVISTVAALIGMIPEGLYLLTSVALALSVLRLSKSKTLVHEMSCIETLARVDVLCVDKTGTITEPDMQVQDCRILPTSPLSQEEIQAVLATFYQNAKGQNATAQALQAYFAGHATSLSPTWSLPFTSETKYSAMHFEEKGTFLVGAPEILLPQGLNELKETIQAYVSQGCRVLLAAKLEGTIADDVRLNGQVIPLALLVLANPIRKQAPATFAYFAKQGVSIKVISGDNPLTVSSVARQAQIEGAERWVDATTLHTNEELYNAAGRYTVFGRVTPQQKRTLIQALKQQGHTVGMTGDGVNDVLALKDADVGIAMASGSEAACQAAHLVLLNSDFASMPQIVSEGRRVINNIERAAALFLVKNIFSLFLSLLTLLVNIPYPVTPLQLSLISAFIIGIPSFVLALEPNDARVTGRFLPKVLGRAFPGGFTILLLVLGAQAVCAWFSFSHAQLSTMCTLLLAAGGLAILVEICRPLRFWRILLCVGMLLGLACSIILFGPQFDLVRLNAFQAVVTAVLMALAYPLVRLLECILSRLCTSLLPRFASFFAKRRQ